MLNNLNYVTLVYTKGQEPMHVCTYPLDRYRLDLKIVI